MGKHARNALTIDPIISVYVWQGYGREKVSITSKSHQLVGLFMRLSANLQLSNAPRIYARSYVFARSLAATNLTNLSGNPQIALTVR